MALENCPFEVTPFDKSNLVKTTELVSVNYTNQDFWSMKSRLIDFIRQRFDTNFNDFVESDLAIMLIENWSFIADTLSFKIDQIANEIFIDSVSEVDNAFRLSLLVGFKPLPPIGSTSMWSATIQNSLETDLAIPVPVVIDITTEDGPRTIELFAADSAKQPKFDEPIIISAGALSNTSIIGIEGRTYEQVQQSSGEKNQFYQLNFGPVIHDSVRVSVDGFEWERVDYFTDGKPRREFRVEFDPDYNAFVQFGNGKAGLIPSPSSDIQFTYRVGGGVAGNITTGSVELQRGFSVPGFEFFAPVTFRNFTRGENGYDGDTIEDIKRKIPAYLRTQDRAVAGTDYEFLSTTFVTPYSGQVGKARAALRHYGCAANIIDIYVLARDGQNGLSEASDGLKVELGKFLDEKKMFTDIICIKDGVVIETDINIDLTLSKFYKKYQDNIEERVERRVNGFFDLNNWKYEKSLKAVDIIKELSDIKEINNIDVTLTTDDENNSGEIVTTKFFEIIRPGTVEINFVYE